MTSNVSAEITDVSIHNVSSYIFENQRKSLSAIREVRNSDACVVVNDIYNLGRIDIVSIYFSFKTPSITYASAILEYSGFCPVQV
jgi:hypothetical protein